MFVGTEYLEKQSMLKMNLTMNKLGQHLKQILMHNLNTGENGQLTCSTFKKAAQREKS